MKNKKSIFQRTNDFIYDSSIDIKDRTYVLFSFLYFNAVVAASLVGVALDEPLSSVFLSVLIVAISMVALFLVVRYNKIKPAKIAVAFLMVFFFQPAMFFMKGGVACGNLFTLFLGTYYLVLVLDGRFRVVMCAIDAIVLVALWIVGYTRPELITEYSVEANYIYSLAKFVIVVLVMTAIITFQTRIYQRENKLAEENAKQLEELNKSQSRFFASMSHEIRTPINTVLGLNEIILRQDDASEEIKKDARNIQGAGKMLLALINDILDVSKIEAGKMDIVPVNYNVASLLSEIVNMIWLKAEEKGLKFNVDIDPEVPETLFGDEVRIKQILINLLNNSVKYTKEGSISLHMECETPDDKDALLKISVSDTGMGIKPEALPHLFDSFQRVDEEKNRHIEGTGLGLSLVKQLVELMDGEITVSSVYTQGSIFTVTVKQGISSDKRVGNINIASSGSAGDSDKFEHSFHAPNARILIVDDNEMNLQVEQKLLEGTEITVDLALSGEEALAKTLRYRYDVIFMDHLMPEMDGIECYEMIRSQMGGLNQTVPIVVLTANAGGENIELYNNTGFDGYLVKPVSGRQLEDMLISHLPAEKVISNQTNEMTGSQMSTASGYAKKKPVIIATSTMSDLPQDIIKEFQISVIPYTVITNEGVFLDSIDIDSEELVRYMGEELRMVTSEPPTEEAYITFFSRELKKAHQIIYISLSTGSSREYTRVTNAVKSFENVSVVNSEYVSSGAGILVMVAAKLARQNMPVDRILAELELAKPLISCSFVIKNTDVMARRGLISPTVNNILNTLWLRPMLRGKNDKLGAGKFFIGSERKCYENYIKAALAAKERPDKTFAFITYVGMAEEDLLWIEEMVRKLGGFEHIMFQKASAGIASNCGAGTFGVLFLRKGEHSYNLGSLFKLIEERNAIDEDALLEAELIDEPDASQSPVETEEKPAVPAEIKVKEKKEPKWYETIPGVDAEAAIKNSGSEAAFESVLKMYYDSYDVKYGELQGFYEAEDWPNYTIKIHALKSSSRLVGVLDLGDKAEALEKAGKSDDIDYIRAHHDEAMSDFTAIRDALTPRFGTTGELPLIPEDTLAEAYGALSEFSEAMDYDCVKMVIDSVAEYSLPDADKERFDKVKTMLAQMDWDGIKEVVQSV